MAFTIDRDRDLITSIRSVAHEETAAALAGLRDPESHGGIVEAVHDCRKRCKKVRGLARLVRPALGSSQFRTINTTYRDAARELSPYRDAHALLATFDAVVAASPDRLPAGGVGVVRAELRRRAQTSTDAVDRRAEPVVRAERLLAAAQAGIDTWSLTEDGWDALGPGLAKTYGRGVDALTAARAEPTPPRYHELRKRSKYTWYHLLLLEQAAPSVLTPLADRFHDLSDGLGDAHDLAVLEAQLRSDPEAFGGPDPTQATLVLSSGRRQLLEDRSVRLAARLYGEPAGRFAARLGRYWDVWHELGDEETVGEVPVVFGSDDDGDGLAALTVADLRSLARSAELPGRSSMGRTDLLGALRAGGVRP